ncbi:DUF3108 domain-containing protein [Marinicellulosiphila megalodicopiae]|uniref:DUF3108 domain-containing protein n=1 Tax=Marinicellulosiphila megalodicopiae TaxID=2724896 RepID=UPI003BAF82AD
MRFIVLALSVFLSTLSFAESDSVELKSFSMQVFAQTFKPVKAKANGTINLDQCTNPQDIELNLWCYRVDTKIKIAEVHQLAKFFEIENTIQSYYIQQDDRAFWKKTHRNAQFDYQNKTVTTLFEDKQNTLDLNTQVFDEVSYPLQIQKLLQQGQTQFKLDLVAGDKIKAYNFKVIDKETLFTKAGILETLIVEQTRGSSKVLIWFAKRWNYLPVQFETYKSNTLQSRVTATSVTY